MTKFLALVLATATSAVLAAAGPDDSVREAGACWRQGAVNQNNSLLQRCLADDLVYTHGGGSRAAEAEYIAKHQPRVPHITSQ